MAETNTVIAKAELKKSLHQSLVSLCDEVEGKIFSEQFQTALLDSSLRLLEHMISKMNDFSSHARRKRISVDDVLLYFRSRPIMVSVLKETMNDTSSDEMEGINNSVLSLGNDSD